MSVTCSQDWEPRRGAWGGGAGEASSRRATVPTKTGRESVQLLAAYTLHMPGTVLLAWSPVSLHRFRQETTPHGLPLPPVSFSVSLRLCQEFSSTGSHTAQNWGCLQWSCPLTSHSFHGVWKSSSFACRAERHWNNWYIFPWPRSRPCLSYLRTCTLPTSSHRPGGLCSAFWLLHRFRIWPQIPTQPLYSSTGCR